MKKRERFTFGLTEIQRKHYLFDDTSSINFFSLSNSSNFIIILFNITEANVGYLAKNPCSNGIY